MNNKNSSLDSLQIKRCYEIFKYFDIQKKRKLEPKTLKLVLNKMGYNIAEEDLYNIIFEVNEKGSDITIEDFINIIDNQKKLLDEKLENEIYDAYIALGGDEEKNNEINLDLIKKILLDDFQMKIDLDSFIEEVDKDKNNAIDYDELKALLSN